VSEVRIIGKEKEKITITPYIRRLSRTGISNGNFTTPRAINMSKNHAGNVIMHSTKKDFCPEKTKMRTKGSNFSPNPTVIALAYIYCGFTITIIIIISTK